VLPLETCFRSHRRIDGINPIVDAFRIGLIDNDSEAISGFILLWTKAQEGPPMSSNR
jgi:hypothetical protein